MSESIQITLAVPYSLPPIKSEKLSKQPEDILKAVQTIEAYLNLPTANKRFFSDEERDKWERHVRERFSPHYADQIEKVIQILRANTNSNSEKAKVKSALETIYTNLESQKYSDLKLLIAEAITSTDKSTIYMVGFKKQLFEIVNLMSLNSNPKLNRN
ncbi:MAG: hypothetical protein V1898_03020 [Patescibacteria group bacterium]